MTKLRIPEAVSLLVLAGCGGVGTVRVTTWGEDFIERGIPASAFEDGWSVTYDEFLVSIGELSLAERNGATGPLLPDFRLWDLTNPGPTALATIDDVPATTWDDASYAIAPSATLAPGNATAEQVARMLADGWSISISATATKDAATKRIRWGFGLNTLYAHCRSDASGEGVTVPAGGTANVQLTVHGDHLFFDDLQSADAKLRFDPIAAADTNDDGEVTLEELAAVDLTRLPPTQYGTGSGAHVRNLRDFVTALARTIGHWQGEGECEPRGR